MHQPTHLIRPQEKHTFPLVTLLLILSTVAVFLMQLYDVATTGKDSILDEFAFSRGNWYGHGWWTVITYAWVHSLILFNQPSLFWAHVTFNMIALLCLGMELENILGHFSFLVLYLGGAVGSVLFWMYLTTPGVVDTHVIGASGAVFAVLGALATAGPRVRVTFFFMPFLPLQMSAGAVAIIALGLEVLSLPLSDGIGHLAHLGGAVFGFFYVLIFHKLLGSPRSEY